MREAEGRPVEILLVEDTPSDVELTIEALKRAKVRNRLSLAEDGRQALEFLRRQGRYANAPRPDLILLDLNLPVKDGREVLAEIKSDPNLKMIPIVVLTGSPDEDDVMRVYHLQANCFIRKPIGIEQFSQIVRSIESFWFCVVALPPQPAPGRNAATSPGV